MPFNKLKKADISKVCLFVWQKGDFRKDWVVRLSTMGSMLGHLLDLCDRQYLCLYTSFKT